MATTTTNFVLNEISDVVDHMMSLELDRESPRAAMHAEAIAKFKREKPELFERAESEARRELREFYNDPNNWGI